MDTIRPREINYEKLLWEARARIQWGDAPEDVAGWLRSEGVDEKRAEETVAACLKERDTEIRTMGRRDMLVGSLLALSGAAAAAVGYNMPWPQRRRQWKLGPMLTGIGAFLAVYGAYRCIRGFGWRVLGGKIQGSMADLAREDEF